MDKRVYLAVAGVVIVMAVIWFTNRTVDPEAGSELEVPANGAAPSALEPVAGSQARSSGAVAHAATPSNASPASLPALRSTPTDQSQTTSAALPIDVAPGFEFLGKPAAEMKDTDFMWPNWRRHQQLQSEPRDDGWAPRMEAALRKGIADTLIAHGHDPSRVELPVVECRTNGCEIQAIGYDADNAKKGVDMQFIIPTLLSGPLAGEFDLDAYSMTLTSAAPQRVAFLAFLPRKKP